MPIYIFQHPKTGEQFEDIRSSSKRNQPFVAPDGVKCPRVLFPENNHITVVDKNAEVWEKDPSYVKQVKPKYVRRRDGVKERYDPTRHC